MDTIALVEDQIDDGRKLLDGLARDGLPVLAGAWVKPAKEDRWSLYVETPLVEEKGAVGAYREVYRVLRSLGTLWLTDSDVTLIGGGHPVAGELAELLHRYPGRLPTRIRPPTLGGVSIEEAYLYPPPRPPLPADSFDLGEVRLKGAVGQVARMEELMVPLSEEERKDLTRLETAGVPRDQAELWLRELRHSGKPRPPIPAGTVVKARVTGWWGERPEDDPDPMLLVEAPDGAQGLTNKGNTELVGPRREG